LYLEFFVKNKHQENEDKLLWGDWLHHSDGVLHRFLYYKNAEGKLQTIACVLLIGDAWEVEIYDIHHPMDDGLFFELEAKSPVRACQEALIVWREHWEKQVSKGKLLLDLSVNLEGF
jgi:hypothetical protein